MAPDRVKTETHPAFICYTPKELRAPVIFENPHSSLKTPDDFQLACDSIHFKRQSDLHLEQIFGQIHRLGLPYLEAQIARCYIDFNRASNSMHPDCILGPTDKIETTTDDFYASAGLGLIRKKAYYGRDIDIIDIPPTQEQVAERITAYWRPYHAQIAKLINQAHTQFGQSLHITCHSFPMANMMEKDKLGGFTFFVGTSDDTRTAPEVKHEVISHLSSLGYNVADNVVFKGVELVKQHGAPKNGRHSLQIEIVREAYMDNDTLEPHEGMRDITDAMESLADHMSEFMLDRCQTPATRPSPLQDQDHTSAHPSPAPGE